MKKSLSVLITFFCGTISYSQVTQEWVAEYNGGGLLFQEPDHRVATDGSGNVYVVATTEADSNYATIKYDSLGVQQWVRTYNGPGNGEDVPKAIAADAAGNVYVTGGSEGSGTARDYATIKYNTLGVEQWVRRFNGPANTHDRAFSIAVDTSGNVYVTGESDGSGTGIDFATVKYSSGGVEQWVRRYNGAGNNNDFGQRITTDVSGNAYVTGTATGAGTETDYATIKYSTLGFEEWVRVYNGPGNLYDWAFSIAADGFGNVYVTGQSWGIASFDDYATVKYNSTGVQQWVQRFDGEGQSSDIARSIGTDESGNVYVTGGSYGSGTDWDFATIKYDTDGAQQWVRTYNGSANNTDAAYAMAVDDFGNVYVTGESWGAGYDFATIKYDPNGVRQWVQGYAGSGDEIAYSIAVDGSGNVYVTGGSQVTPESLDYITIRYSQVTTTSQGWVAQTSGTQNNLYGVYFNNASNGIVVGASGTILRTTDGGASWVDLSIARPDTFFSVCFSDENTGIIVGGIPSGGGSVILRTTDGGQSWNEQVPGTSNALRSIFCIDNDVAVAVGESGTILRTTDAGMTWNPQASCYSYVLFAVTFVDNDIGIKATGWPATGNGGPIGLTSDGGVSWICPLAPGPILTSVSFGDQSTGFVAGEFGVILKSTDAGNSWNVLTTGEDSDLHGVSFTDPNTGTVVGQDGTILSTTDGGVVWFTRASGTAVSLNGVFFVDSQTGWAVGNNGTILHTMDGVSSVEETTDFPKTHLLHQNYPNPFNSISDFGFRISDFGFVSLAIYDLLGREVATLLNQRLSPGTYTRQWDATGHPSGVYFYRLQAGDFTQTRKLILLR